MPCDNENDKKNSGDNAECKCVNGEDSANDSTAGEVCEEGKIEIEKYKDLEKKFAYLYADFENYRRRMNKEISDILTYGHKDFVLSILEVLDDLERAVNAVDPATNEWLVPVVSKFTRALADNGIKKIETKKEDLYNAEFHNALATEGTSTDGVARIKDIVRSGYFLKEKVIRHVDVIVDSIV